MQTTSKTAIGFASTASTTASKEADIQTERAETTGRTQKIVSKNASSDFATMLKALLSQGPANTARTATDAADQPAQTGDEQEQETPRIKNSRRKSDLQTNPPAQADVPAIAPARRTVQASTAAPRESSQAAPRPDAVSQPVSRVAEATAQIQIVPDNQSEAAAPELEGPIPTHAPHKKIGAGSGRKIENISQLEPRQAPEAEPLGARSGFQNTDLPEPRRHKVALESLALQSSQKKPAQQVASAWSEQEITAHRSQRSDPTPDLPTEMQTFQPSAFNIPPRTTPRMDHPISPDAANGVGTAAETHPSERTTTLLSQHVAAPIRATLPLAAEVPLQPYRPAPASTSAPMEKLPMWQPPVPATPSSSSMTTSQMMPHEPLVAPISNPPTAQPEAKPEDSDKLQAGQLQMAEKAGNALSMSQPISGSGPLANQAQSNAGYPSALPLSPDTAAPQRPLDPLQTESARITVRAGADYKIITGANKSKPVAPARAQEAIGNARMASATELTFIRPQETIPAFPASIAPVTPITGLTTPALPPLSAHDSAKAHLNSDPATSLLGVTDPMTDLAFEPARLFQTTPATSAQLRADLAPHVARQIVEGVQHAPNRPIEIALSPQELGRVRVSIKIEDKSIVVNILAERGETLDLMRRHIDHLGQTFRSIGYDSVSFSFGQRAQGDTQTGEHAARDKAAPNRGDDAQQFAPSQTDVTAPPPLRAATSGLDIRL